MTLKEIKNCLEQLSRKGFVPTRRKGPTGVGHTLEQELGLTETNLAIPDIGGRVELKTTRKNTNSMVTLFTFNRAVWQVHPKEIVEKFGYLDEQNRCSLYSTVFHGQPNPQNLSIEIDREQNKVHLYHTSGILLGTWSIFIIVGKFISKLERLLLVLADTKHNEDTGSESFHFSEAYLLENPSPDNFLDAFANSQIAIDIRMHLRDSGSVRNHGTGFRIKENYISYLYESRKKIL